MLIFLSFCLFLFRSVGSVLLSFSSFLFNFVQFMPIFVKFCSSVLRFYSFLLNSCQFCSVLVQSLIICVQLNLIICYKSDVHFWAFWFKFFWTIQCISSILLQHDNANKQTIFFGLLHQHQNIYIVPATARRQEKRGNNSFCREWICFNIFFFHFLLYSHVKDNSIYASTASDLIS